MPISKKLFLIVVLCIYLNLYTTPPPKFNVGTFLIFWQKHMPENKLNMLITTYFAGEFSQLSTDVLRPTVTSGLDQVEMWLHWADLKQ